MTMLAPFDCNWFSRHGSVAPEKIHARGNVSLADESVSREDTMDSDST